MCDESHRLKNRKAAVTKAVFGKWHKDPQKRIEPIKAGKILLLTGTPILNRPEELWTTCHAIDPFGVGKSWWDFVHKYCAAKKTRFGIDTSGASNLQELKERISPFTIRRLKKDVLKELPEKREQVIVLQPDPEQAQAVKAEREAVEMSELNLDNPNLNIMLNQIAILRQQTALTKLSSCYDIFSDDLQSSKLVIMAHHRAVCEAIHQNYPNSVMVYGGMSERDKQKAIERFQNDKNCNVFVGSISAAGVGITLTAASQLSFVEFDWTPGKMAQAADRIHHIENNFTLKRNTFIRAIFRPRKRRFIFSGIIRQETIFRQSCGAR
ncbi:MAG: DEAD/DEAH box helicase [Desulfobacterales bacterium]